MTNFPARRQLFNTLASIVIGLTACIVVACSSTNGAATGNMLPSQSLRPAAAPTATPYKYSYNTVDDEGGSTTFNQVLGMNDLGAVVGYYENASFTHGFTSFPPYSTFHVIEYPNAVTTVATSTSNNKIIAGYFTQTTKVGTTTLGFIRDKGLWATYKDFHTPKGPDPINELLGVNGNDIAVGFYVDAYGNDQPYAVANRQYSALKPPGYVSARATGVNLRGDIVGSAVLNDGTTVGWVYRAGNYREFSFPNSTDTEPTSLNIQNQIAGSYVDASGNTHGFVVTDLANTQRVLWQTIDEPNAVGTTVVTTVNNHHNISGWYIDSDGNTNGFVATVSSN